MAKDRIVEDTPPDEELSMLEAVVGKALENAFSFDTLMAIALGHLIKRGYRPAEDGGSFRVVPPEKSGGPPRRLMTFTEALTVEAEIWFRADALKALGPTKATGPTKAVRPMRGRH